MSKIIDEARGAAIIATERFDAWDVSDASEAAADAAVRVVLEHLCNEDNPEIGDQAYAIWLAYEVERLREDLG